MEPKKLVCEVANWGDDMASMGAAHTRSPPSE